MNKGEVVGLSVEGFREINYVDVGGAFGFADARTFPAGIRKAGGSDVRKILIEAGVAGKRNIKSC